MPLKRGPHHTWRWYDSSNGQYSRGGFLLIDQTPYKKSKEQKEKERRDLIALQARNSKDNDLYNVYKILESSCPGCVTHINCLFYDKNTKSKCRELDIVTKNAVYEIKSGKSRHKTKQFFLN